MKEFGLFGVIHTPKYWHRLKRTLDKLPLEGKTILFETTKEALDASKEYVSDPKRQLELVVFNDFVAEYARKRNITLLPLEVRRAKLVYARHRETSNFAKATGNFSKFFRAERALEKAALIRETGFKLRVKKIQPDYVIVGVNHIGAFKGMPHKIVMNEKRFAQTISPRVKKIFRLRELSRKRRETLKKIRMKQLQKRKK